MDKPDIELARKHVVLGRRIVFKQLRRVQQRVKANLPTEQAQSLLDTFRQSLAIFEEHLAQLEKDSAQLPK